jgi:hypothetical protein
MRWRVNPFSAGAYVGLSAFFLLAAFAVFWAGHALAISNVGPDPTDFKGNSPWYTLSDTHDVKNTRGMGLTVYRQGAAPTAPITITVTYKGGAVTCVNQHGQGNAGVHFSYGNGSGSRQTSLTIPVSAWHSNGVGYTADISATIVNGDNTCQGAENGNHVNFKLTAPSGYLIGPDSSKDFAVVQNVYCVSYNPSAHSCNDYTTYNIPFGPPCTTTTNGSATVQIIDMDNKNSPVIQPTPAVVKIIDTTTGAVVNNNSYTGSQGNGGTANFKFNYTAQHNYKLQISNLNMNNVLQLQLPFDSVNAVINCAPRGGITSSVGGACTAIQGWMYDPDSPSTQLRYYVYTNPAGTPSAKYTSPPADSKFWGQFTANQPNPGGTPGGTPSNHGFKVSIPANVQGHGYNGPWLANKYYIYAKDASSNDLTQIGSVTVPQNTCASVSCGTSNFNVDTVGEPTSFTVNMKVNGGATDTPPGASFLIKVTGPNNQTYNNVNDNNPSGGYIYSDAVSFTPTASGIYNVTWSYFGVNCGGVSDKAAFAPYFQTLGGDIAAGAGFGATCTEQTAMIRSWNLNTEFSPNYSGAGSQIAAWATGDITDFVSGMGLSGGAASSNGYGLSFANTLNTGGENYGGRFGTGAIPCLYDYYGHKPSPAPSLPGAPGQLNDFSAASGDYAATTVAGGFTVGSGADLYVGQETPGGPGKQLNIYVDGNLYIKSNILYQYANTYGIPKVSFLVRGNIYIAPNVTELHGVFVAQKAASSGGNLNTCATSMSDTVRGYNECNHPLKIVGSVAAESGIKFMRSYGNLIAAGGVPNTPAETIVYSPELWLAAPIDSGFKNQAYTSLPPVL